MRACVRACVCVCVCVKRHKCRAEKEKPVHEQRGGGFSVRVAADDSRVGVA